MRKRLATGVVLPTLLSLVIGNSAVADPGTATHVDSVAASVGATTVSVSGAATFVDVPVSMVADPAGDAAVSGIGADVTTGSISRPSPTGGLTFTLNVSDMPADPASTAPHVVYIWPLAVDDVDGGFYLEARRVSAPLVFGGPNQATPAFVLMHDHADGFHWHANLTGTMAGGVVRFSNVSLSAIQAASATKLSQGAAGGGMGTTTAVPGALRFNANFLGDAVAMDSEYTIPVAKVQLGIAPAGTPEAAVPLTVSGTVNATTGAFSGALPRPAAGNYVVVAKACYGPSSCGLSSTTVTV